jgi:hypothetical protein
MTLLLFMLAGQLSLRLRQAGALPADQHQIHARGFAAPKNARSVEPTRLAPPKRKFI